MSGPRHTPCSERSSRSKVGRLIAGALSRNAKARPGEPGESRGGSQKVKESKKSKKSRSEKSKHDLQSHPGDGESTALRGTTTHRKTESDDDSPQAVATSKTLLKSVLASKLNVQEFCPRAQDHVGRVEEIRKRAFSHLKQSCVPPKPSTKCLDI